MREKRRPYNSNPAPFILDTIRVMLLTPDIYRAAQNELAFCLCEAYQLKDTAADNRIMKIYKETGTPVGPDSIDNTKYSGVDTIMKYRRKAFDTLILVD